MIQHSDMARSFLYSCKYIYIYIHTVCVCIYIWADFRRSEISRWSSNNPPPEAIPTTPPSVWPRWFVESLLPKPGRNQGGARMPQLKGIKKTSTTWRHLRLFHALSPLLQTRRSGCNLWLGTWLFNFFQTFQKKKPWLSNFKEPCWSCSIYFLGGGP